MTGVDDDNFHRDTAREILFASDLITSACASCPHVGKKRPERGCTNSARGLSGLSIKKRRRWLMHKILFNVHQREGGLVDAQDEEKVVDAQDCQPPHRFTSHPHQPESTAVRVDIGQ